MKLSALVFSTLGLFVVSLSASAMDWTARIEARDSMASASVCNGFVNCSPSSAVGFGAGLTSSVWNFASDWSLFSGALVRQRIVAVSSAASGSTTYLDLDIPVEIQWNLGMWSFRAGVDVGFNLGSNYQNRNASNFSDNSVVVPGEIGVDWKLTPNHLIGVTYETGLTMSNTYGGFVGNPLATSGVASLAYGYTF